MDKRIEASHLTVWQLIKTYWQSDQRFGAYLLYSILVVLTITVVGAEVVLNYWYNYFYNALQAYNQHEAVRLLLIFFAIAFTYIILLVIRYFIWQVFGLNWRRWLTQQLIDRWLKGRGYYYLENFDVKTDNPDQRIQDDAGALIASSIDLSISLIGNILTVVGFSYILWHLSGDDLAIPLGSLGTWHVHGYLMWVAFLYSLVGTLLTLKIGYPLVPLNFEQQRREANFRFAAMDLRSHAEDVALYHGEQQQKSILRRLFGSVLENTYMIILRQTKLLSFTAGFGQLSVALPLIVVVPIYFKKIILLGGLMQSLRAFGSLQDALSFIVNSYPQIAQWRATGQRLTTFLNHLTEVEEKAEQESHLKVAKQPVNAITTQQLTISTPRDRRLLQNIEETFIHGNNYLIKGASGIGKSTFIRTVAGIWPFASGKIIFPENKNVMYLPQKPYMPMGTLAQAIAFPNDNVAEFADQLKKVLKDSNLGDFISRLQETAPWSEQLSFGEQQRIAFARVLLQKPDWVFLDESTSMLDLANEKHLYALLKSQLPHCSIISVGHRPSLDEFHDQIIDITKYSCQY
jgi:putative ATP-binding cassette transporter